MPTPCSSGFNRSATAGDIDLLVPVDCAGTADPTIGATCSVDTTANAVAPGSIEERNDSVIQFFRVRLNDLGANGILGDSDDKLFAQEGAFIP